MRWFWRIFWWLRLFVAGYLTYRAVIAWDDQHQLVRELAIMTVWTMWTSDMPDGRDDS